MCSWWVISGCSTGLMFKLILSDALLVPTTTPDNLKYNMSQAFRHHNLQFVKASHHRNQPSEQAISSDSPRDIGQEVRSGKSIEGPYVLIIPRFTLGLKWYANFNRPLAWKLKNPSVKGLFEFRRFSLTGDDLLDVESSCVAAWAVGQRQWGWPLNRRLYPPPRVNPGSDIWTTTVDFTLLMMDLCRRKDNRCYSRKATSTCTNVYWSTRDRFQCQRRIILVSRVRLFP